MELSDWTKIFDLLGFRSRVASLNPRRRLTEFFEGLGAGPLLVREHLASILVEPWPATTTFLLDWSEQFGAAEDLTVSELEAEWAATGGQDPDYFMAMVHAAGFTSLYMHEWWDPSSTTYPIPRDPSPQWIVDNAGGRLLVNDMGRIDKHYVHQFRPMFRADQDQFEPDGDVHFGNFGGYKWYRKIYPHADYLYEQPYYFVLCDAVYGVPARINWDRLRFLENLIFKLKPCRQRCVLLVIPDGETDIQDVIEETDPEYQDAISAADDINDQA